jgi:hypothetical protein
MISRFLPAIVIALSLLAAGLFAVRSQRAESKLRHRVVTRANLLSDGDIVELKRDGLDDPPRQLRDSLVTHTELIPEKTTHGQMMIVPGEHIVLLASPYAFALYTDGLNQGHMLLEYTVLPGPRIEWKRLWWTRE